jgi:thioredoxin reductase (NADPH)
MDHPNGTAATERDVYDITVVGFGPTGQFAAFYAGLRGARTQVIDALEEPGGALTAIYPEKYIYDVIGFPRVLAKEFVEKCDEQARRGDPTVRLKEQVHDLERMADGTLRLGTSAGDRWSKDGHRLRRGWSLRAEARGRAGGGHPRSRGRGVHYFRSERGLPEQAGVVIVVVALCRRLGGDARGRSPGTSPWSTARSSAPRGDGRGSPPLVGRPPVPRLRDDGGGDRGGRPAGGGHDQGRAGAETPSRADDLIVAIGFVADLGPLKSWASRSSANQVVVDKISMATNIPGVFAAATWPRTRPSSS